MAKFCSGCGKELKEGSSFCSNCGRAQDEKVEYDRDVKSRLGAGLLGIFLGCLGVHNFYLGYTNKGIAQLLLTLIGSLACGLGPIAAAIWGLVEGIMILSGSIATDANGVKLKD